MIDEELHDQASLYVLRMLPPDEETVFAARLVHDAELKAIVADLEASAAFLACAAPIKAPPVGLKERIMADVRHEVRVAPETLSQRFAWLPWALAACLALAATMFWNDAQTQADRAEQQERTVASLRERDTLATVQIAALGAKVSAYEKALAVIVYDAKDQRGLVKLDRFPKAEAGKDYQLWVIPSGGQPISGGLVPVGEDGLSRVSFKPAQAIQKGIDAFAISVEPSGGSQLPRGEVIFVGK